MNTNEFTSIIEAEINVRIQYPMIIHIGHKANSFVHNSVRNAVRYNVTNILYYQVHREIKYNLLLAI